MKQTGIIIEPDEMHGRNNIPFIKSEKKTKQYREYNKYNYKKQVGGYQQIRQDLSPTPTSPRRGGNYLTKKALGLFFISFFQTIKNFVQFL